MKNLIKLCYIYGIYHDQIFWTRSKIIHQSQDELRCHPTGQLWKVNSESDKRASNQVSIYEIPINNVFKEVKRSTLSQIRSWYKKRWKTIEKINPRLLRLPGLLLPRISSFLTRWRRIRKRNSRIISKIPSTQLLKSM